MVPIQRSFHILMRYEPFKKAVEENNQQEFENILWQAGVDIELPYEVISCEHRVYPDSDNPLRFNGPCVFATERRDKEWLKGGVASWNAIVESCDAGLRADLKVMGRQSGTDRAFDKYDSENYSVE